MAYIDTQQGGDHILGYTPIQMFIVTCGSGRMTMAYGGFNYMAYCIDQCFRSVVWLHMEMVITLTYLAFIHNGVRIIVNNANQQKKRYDQWVVAVVSKWLR